MPTFNARLIILVGQPAFALSAARAVSTGAAADFADGYAGELALEGAGGD